MDQTRRALLAIGRSLWQSLWIGVLIALIHDVVSHTDPSGYRWFAWMILIAITIERILSSIISGVLRHVNKIQES